MTSKTISLSSNPPYYDIDMTFKEGGLVTFNPIGTHPLPPNLTRGKAYSIIQVRHDLSQKSHLAKQVIIIEDDHGNPYITNGLEVVKYDTYLIFKVMGFMMNLVHVHTGKKVRLPS